MVPFLLYMLKTGFGFCSFLCSVALSGVLPEIFITKTLASSLICYLSSVLIPLPYFRNCLMETNKNYTSSKRIFVEEIENGTFTTFLYDVFSLVIATLQYLKHSWVMKILLLVFLRILFWLFPTLTSNLGISHRRCNSVVMGGKVSWFKTI